VVAKQLPTLNIQRRDVDSALAPFEHATNATVPAARSSEGAPHDLANGVDGLWWYHTIDLPDGITTPGYFDHRPLVPHYGIPSNLDGADVLDVATCDGFWAFEFERRGARVVATDISRFEEYDFPPPIRRAMKERGIDRDTGAAFRFAKAALASHVERREVNVYDLSPETVGMFDVVHAGELLLRLQDPLKALRARRSVTRRSALLADCVDPALPSGTTHYLGGWSSVSWWNPSIDVLGQMISDAGFSDVRVQAMYRLGSRDAVKGPWRVSFLASV